MRCFNRSSFLAEAIRVGHKKGIGGRQHQGKSTGNLQVV
jgi:hypothetical protein